MNEVTISHQIAISAAVVWALERLKRWPQFAWIDANSDTVNRIVSIAAALVTAVGLQANMAGTFQAGGTLTITWPSLLVMRDAASHFASQLAMQEIIYRTAVKKPAPGAVQASAKSAAAGGGA